MLLLNALEKFRGLVTLAESSEDVHKVKDYIRVGLPSRLHVVHDLFTLTESVSFHQAVCLHRVEKCCLGLLLDLYKFSSDDSSDLLWLQNFKILG